MGDANDFFLMNLEAERTQLSTHTLCVPLLPVLSVLIRNVSRPVFNNTSAKLGGLNCRRCCCCCWIEYERRAYGQRFLQPSRLVIEAVQHQVFSHTINPLPARRDGAAHKLSSLLPARAERLDRLRRKSARGWTWQRSLHHCSGVTRRTFSREGNSQLNKHTFWCPPLNDKIRFFWILCTRVKLRNSIERSVQVLPGRACSGQPPCWSGYTPQSALGVEVGGSRCWQGPLKPGTQICECARIPRTWCSRSKI